MMWISRPYGAIPSFREDLSNIGSTLNCFGAKKVIEIQKNYMAHNRHHIPLLFMGDVIHGYKTVFPIPLALSCSFNPQNYENAASVAAAESSVSGIQLTFSPMSDLVHDPRWGRVMESPGEDPLLKQPYDYRRRKRFSRQRSEGKGESCLLCQTLCRLRCCRRRTRIQLSRTFRKHASPVLSSIL